METLTQNSTHRLEREYINKGEARGWWFTLIEISTGMTQTLIAQDKRAFDNTTCEKFKQWADGMGAQPVKMYKFRGVLNNQNGADVPHVEVAR